MVEDLTGSTCGCAPAAPRLKWRLATAQNRGSVIVKPFEDEEAASKHEQDLKAIPAPVRAFLHCHQDHFLFDIKLNIDSVAHRVVASLMTGTPGEIRLNWRIARDDGLQDPPSFKPVKASGYQTNDPMTPASSCLKSGFQLQPWQRQSIYWMQQQEIGDNAWAEWDRLEYRLPAIDWRLEVEGMKFLSVKGGILADTPGTGKTLTTMVLAAEDARNHKDTDKVIGKGLIPLKSTLFLIPNTLFDQWKAEKVKFIQDDIICLYIKTFADLAKRTIEDFQKADFIFVSWDLFGDKSAGTSYWDHFRKTTNAFNVPSLAGRGFDQWLSEACRDLQDLIADSKEKESINLGKFNKARQEKLAAAQTKYGDIFRAFRKSDTEATKKPSSSKKQKKDGKTDAKTNAKADVEPGAEIKAKKPRGLQPIESKGIADAGAQIEGRLTELYQPAQPQARDDNKGAVDNDQTEWAGQDLEKIMPLLQMFQYRRLVVDEFPYLRDQVVSCIIHLSAERRWMLSGTPPLHNYISISYMAKLLGTAITPRADLDALVNFWKANKSLIHDKTSAEDFKQQLDTQTAEWVRKQNERAREFAERFVRQNERPPNEKIVHHYEVDPLSLLESYLYCKAFQNVNGQIRETEVVDGKKTQDAKIMARDDEFFKFFKNDKSAVNAMINCLLLLTKSYMDSFEQEDGKDFDITILEGLVKEKDGEFIRQVGQIAEVLAKALNGWHCKQKAKPEMTRPEKAKEEEEEQNEEQGGKRQEGEENTPLAVYLENILDHNFGDRSVSGVLSKVAKACSRDHGVICVKEDAKSKTVGGQRQLATDLNTLTKEVVQIVQERRLLRQVLALGLDREGTHKCQVCEGDFVPEQLTVMSLCGHLTCKECLDGEGHLSEKLNGCPVLGCSGPGSDSGIPAVRFSSPASGVEENGTKVSSLLRVLRNIRRDAPGERALVFLQGAIFKAKVATAIAAEFGNQVVANAAGGSDTAVSRFGRNEKARILILPIDSINAAGWNLQMCNHVIFVCPFLSRSKADWQATMDQAVGRCARHGQSQTVHVYHLLSSATLEMEIFQARGGGRFALGPQGGWAWMESTPGDLSGAVVGPRLGAVEEEGEEEEEEEAEEAEEAE